MDNVNGINDVPTYTHIERTSCGTTNARDPMACIGLSDSNLPKERNFVARVQIELSCRTRGYQVPEIL